MNKLTEQQRLIFLTKVLSQAILEIREESHKEKLPKSFYLADLVHNLPNHLLQMYIRPDEVSLNDVFIAFEKRSKGEQVKAWVEGIKNSLDFDSHPE